MITFLWRWSERWTGAIAETIAAVVTLKETTATTSPRPHCNLNEGKKNSFLSLQAVYNVPLLLSSGSATCCCRIVSSYINLFRCTFVKLPFTTLEIYRPKGVYYAENVTGIAAGGQREIKVSNRFFQRHCQKGDNRQVFRIIVYR